MSRLDLTAIELEPLEFAERVTVPAGTGGEDVLSLSQVSLAGRVERTSRGFHLSGRVEVEVGLRCVRCLEAYAWSVRERVEVDLLPLSAAPREEETQLGRADLEARFFAEPVLDLAELAAEQIELALPMKPLCAPSCRGLCPRCGANLNHERCGCPREADPRWESLAHWRPPH